MEIQNISVYRKQEKEEKRNIWAAELPSIGKKRTDYMGNTDKSQIVLRFRSMVLRLVGWKECGQRTKRGTGA